MTGGQYSSLYLGLALLTDIDIAQHCLRSPKPASYADLMLSAHSFLLMKNDFASKHGRAVHPRALKTYVGTEPSLALD